eukprot:3870077-Prymnesium_polylepis.1
MVHDAIVHRKERFWAEHLGEEVGIVVRARHEGDHDLQILHTLTHEVVTPVDVLHAQMVLRVVGHGDRRLVVNREARGSPKPRSLRRPRTSAMASLAASDAATISASHEDSAAVACFLEPQEMAADIY